MLSGKKGYIITAAIVLLAVFGLVEWSDHEAGKVDGGRPPAVAIDPASVVPTESPDLSGTYGVGVIAPEADMDRLQKSLQLASETVNSGLGIAGKKLVFDYETADAASAASVAASSSDRFVITTLPESAFASLSGDGPIVLSTAGPDTGDTASDRLFSLGVGSDPSGGAAAAGRYAVVDLKGKRIAAISGPDAASVAVRRAFGEAVRRAGGSLVDDEVGTVATGSGLASVKASKPDVLFVYASDGALRKVLADEAARESQIKILTVGLPAAASDAGSAETLPAGTLAFAPEFDVTETRAAEFMHQYAVRFGAAPDDIGQAAVSNAMPYLIRDLVQKDGDDPAKMTKTLETMIAGWSGGAIGSLSIDRNGDAVWDRFEVLDFGGATPTKIGTTGE